MNSKLLVALTLAALCGAAGAVDAQDATEFCAAYETTCKDIGTNFANTTACETWYSAADAGTLADPISDTAAGATRACYQYHLSLAGGAATDAATTHCPHAKGTAVCVAPPAVDAKAAKDAKAVKDAEAAEAAAAKAKVDEAAKVRVVFAPVRIPRAAQMCPLLTFLAPVEPYIREKCTSAYASPVLEGATRQCAHGATATVYYPLLLSSHPR
jgi:hypothetical protein